MKKSIFLIALLGLLLMVSACAKQEAVELSATVLETSENGILVEPDEGTDARGSADKIFFTCDNAADFAPGDRVLIVFDGAVAESYPGQAKAQSVKLLSDIAIPID